MSSQELYHKTINTIVWAPPHLFYLPINPLSPLHATLYFFLNIQATPPYLTPT